MSNALIKKLESQEVLKQFEMALPEDVNPEKFVRTIRTALLRSPNIANCDPSSVIQCCMDLATVGLTPDGRRAHLIPFKNKCQLIVDYKGLIELAKNNGDVSLWRADKVCENDEFTYENGLVSHKPDFRKPRGSVFAFYSHVKYKDGTDDYEVLHMDEVEAIKKRSKAGNSGPWVSDFDEMGKKTAIKRHSKRLTLSPEARALADMDYDKLRDVTPKANEGMSSQAQPKPPVDPFYEGMEQYQPEEGEVEVLSPDFEIEKGGK